MSSFSLSLSSLPIHARTQTRTSKLYENAEQYETSLMCSLHSADFVLLKLQKEAVEDATFLVRWSAVNYDNIILAVLSKNEVLIAMITVQLL